MESISLTGLADEQLHAARASTAGRAAHTVHGGHDHMLRQTLIALVAGRELAEHESPGQATLQVLRGRVRLRTADDEWHGGTGDYLVLPRERHSLHADEDAVVLLTVLADS
ncbi:MAG: cupin domain-containing protein [Mycobacterium sp.]